MMNRFVVVACLVAGGALAVRGAEETVAKPPYLDPAVPLERRVDDLIGRLTLDEKAQLMRNGSPGVARLGIPKYDWWNEALHGVARAGEATVFPQAIGLAATWDVPLLQRVAGAIGVEARAKFNAAPALGKAGERYYGLTFWSPNINIFRDPRWGRGQETYGEDPLLTARLGVAFVRGLQGDDPRYLQAAACAKHFAVHSGPEPLRHHFDVRPSAADLYDTYLPAFEALVREARVESVMTAYNALYGKPCSISPLLYGLLQQWGFDGHVVSDCGSIADLTRTYGLARDDAEAEALSIGAGLCLRCGDDEPALAGAVRAGLIRESEVDAQLHKLLRTMFRLGFFEPAGAVAYNRIAPSENLAPAHGELARETARKSIVLLKNSGVLPLDPAKLRRIAVVGPNASSETVLLGNYHGRPVAPVTVLAGLRAALGDAVAIDYVRGCDYVDALPEVVPIPRTGLRHTDNTGLIGEYFANGELKGDPVAKRRDRPVHFNFARDPLPPGVPAKGVSVRWTGHLVTATAGEYQLVVSGMGGFRLWVDGRPVIDDWWIEEKSRSAKVRLPENALVPVVFEYRQGDEPARVSLGWRTPEASGEFAAAVAAARRAEAVVFVGGISAQLEGEEMQVPFEGFNGGDRTRIELPAVQQKLLEELVATGRPVVGVFMSGSALAMPWADEHLGAVVQAWYGGQAAGTAVAEVLLGRTNPSGRLPVTFYRATEDLPPFGEYAMEGRTYRFFRGRPLYAFGHGLSYTTFAYSQFGIAPGKDDPAVVAQAVVTVANTGSRAGEEVVQVYGTPPAGATREQVALLGFARVALAPGETKVVAVPIRTTAVRRWNEQAGAYEIPAGEWTLHAGASAADLRQTTRIVFRER